MDVNWLTQYLEVVIAQKMGTLMMIAVISVLLHDKYSCLSLPFPTLNSPICLVSTNHHLKSNTTDKYIKYLASSFLLFLGQLHLLLLFKFTPRKHLQLHFAGKMVSNHRCLTNKFIITMKMKSFDVIVDDPPMSRFLLEKSVGARCSI